LYVSGGNDDVVLVFDFKQKQLSLADTIFLKEKEQKAVLSVTGLAFNLQKKQLYVVTKESNQFIAIDVIDKSIIKKIILP
jgi:uncharacterized protein YjiK